MDGGLELARKCMHKLIPAVKITPPTFDVTYPQIGYRADIAGMEAIVGYRFNQPFLLIEALTHPSCERDHLTQSYQRLEFLGDAVIDAIIAMQLVQHACKKSPGNMTRIKAAMVNAHLLGFVCLEFTHSAHFDTVQEASRDHFVVTAEVQQQHLWQLMRCNSDAVRANSCESVERFRELGPSIRQLMNHGSTYPWLELTVLQPEKFFSDIIESLVGAIHVDSGGCLDECTTFLERLGLMAYLRRLMTETIEVVHPRTKLDWKTGSNTVRYQMSKEHEQGRGFSCAVVVADQIITQVTGSATPDEAIIRGAQAVLKLENELC